MTNSLKNFFYPPELIYSYSQSKQTIIDIVTKVLSKRVAFFSDTDVDVAGLFLTENMFALSVAHGPFSSRLPFGSTLVGDIVEVRRGVTEIRTKVRPGFILYVLFFISIIGGLVSLTNLYKQV